MVTGIATYSAVACTSDIDLTCSPPQRPAGAQRVRRRVTSSKGRRVERDDAVADLEARRRLLQEVAPAGGHDPPVARRRWCGARSPHASCSRTTRSPEPSSASLTASTSTPAPVTVTTRAGSPDAVPPSTTRTGRSRRSASATTSARPGPVREQADGHLVAALVGVGVGVAGGAGQADPHGAVEQGVAVAPVVEHGDAERRLGDVDVAVGADLELGRVPRRRRVRRPAHRPELHAARRRVGPDVERERQRQQVLAVVPVELDVHVEPGRPGPQDVRQHGRRRPERAAHAHRADERAPLDDVDGLDG